MNLAPFDRKVATFVRRVAAFTRKVRETDAAADFEEAITPTRIGIAHEHIEIIAGDGFVDIKTTSAAIDDDLHVELVRISDRHVEALISGLQDLRGRS